jgi:hypothetical protein
MAKRDLRELVKSRRKLVEAMQDLLALRDEVKNAERRLAPIDDAGTVAPLLQALFVTR